jgi:hypothetical protein
VYVQETPNRCHTMQGEKGGTPNSIQKLVLIPCGAKLYCTHVRIHLSKLNTCAEGSGIDALKC